MKVSFLRLLFVTAFIFYLCRPAIPFRFGSFKPILWLPHIFKHIEEKAVFCPFLDLQLSVITFAAFQWVACCLLFFSLVPFSDSNYVFPASSPNVSSFPIIFVPILTAPSSSLFPISIKFFPWIEPWLFIFPVQWQYDEFIFIFSFYWLSCPPLQGYHRCHCK